MSIAHIFKDKVRTEDVLISESVDFSGLLLSNHVLQGLTDAGFKRPSPIQLKAIPLGRCGLDLIVQAKSGTGKTCVFTVVALESLVLQSVCIQVLVLAPTREIAIQIHDVMHTVGRAMKGLKCHTFIGGLPLQVDKSVVKSCHIAVGTPGRVKQLIEIGALKTSSIRLFILDEADKLLEGEFQESINWIYSTLPDNKQILALSATYPELMAQHLTAYMRNPTFVRLNVTDPALLGIKQYHVVVPNHHMPNIVFNSKTEVVLKILSSVSFQQCLIFSNLQTRAQNLQSELQSRNWPTACIAGYLDQKERNFAMEQLKTYKCRILISTDLTSRGIDADKVNLVINLDVSPDHETYLHRIGRAGRFGSFGAAVTIVTKGGQDAELWAVERKCGTYIHKLPDPIPNDLVTKALPLRIDDIVSTQQIINKPVADMETFSVASSDDNASSHNQQGTCPSSTNQVIQKNGGKQKSLSYKDRLVANEAGNVNNVKTNTVLVDEEQIDLLDYDQSHLSGMRVSDTEAPVVGEIINNVSYGLGSLSLYEAAVVLEDSYRVADNDCMQEVSTENTDSCRYGISTENTNSCMQEVSIENTDSYMQEVSIENTDSYIQEVSIENTDSYIQEVSIESTDSCIREVSTENTDSCMQEVSTENTDSCMQEVSTEKTNSSETLECDNSRFSDTISSDSSVINVQHPLEPLQKVASYIDGISRVILSEAMLKSHFFNTQAGSVCSSVGYEGYEGKVVSENVNLLCCDSGNNTLEVACNSHSSNRTTTCLEKVVSSLTVTDSEKVETGGNKVKDLNPPTLVDAGTDHDTKSFIEILHETNEKLTCESALYRSAESTKSRRRIRSFGLTDFIHCVNEDRNSLNSKKIGYSFSDEDENIVVSKNVDTTSLNGVDQSCTGDNIIASKSDLVTNTAVSAQLDLMGSGDFLDVSQTLSLEETSQLRCYNFSGVSSDNSTVNLQLKSLGGGDCNSFDVPENHMVSCDLSHDLSEKCIMNNEKDILNNSMCIPEIDSRKHESDEWSDAAITTVNATIYIAPETVVDLLPSSKYTDFNKPRKTLAAYLSSLLLHPQKHNPQFKCSELETDHINFCKEFDSQLVSYTSELQTNLTAEDVDYQDLEEVCAFEATKLETLKSIFMVKLSEARKNDQTGLNRKSERDGVVKKLKISKHSCDTLEGGIGKKSLLPNDPLLNKKQGQKGNFTPSDNTDDECRKLDDMHTQMLMRRRARKLRKPDISSDDKLPVSNACNMKTIIEFKADNETRPSICSETTEKNGKELNKSTDEEKYSKLEENTPVKQTHKPLENECSLVVETKSVQCANKESDYSTQDGEPSKSFIHSRSKQFHENQVRQEGNIQSTTLRKEQCKLKAAEKDEFMQSEYLFISSTVRKRPTKPSKSEARLAGLEISSGSTSSTSDLSLSSPSDISDISFSDIDNKDIILTSQCYANKYAQEVCGDMHDGKQKSKNNVNKTIPINLVNINQHRHEQSLQESSKPYKVSAATSRRPVTLFPPEYQPAYKVDQYLQDYSITSCDAEVGAKHTNSEISHQFLHTSAMHPQAQKYGKEISGKHRSQTHGRSLGEDQSLSNNSEHCHKLRKQTDESCSVHSHKLRKQKDESSSGYSHKLRKQKDESSSVHSHKLRKQKDESSSVHSHKMRKQKDESGSGYSHKLRKQKDESIISESENESVTSESEYESSSDFSDYISHCPYTNSQHESHTYFPNYVHPHLYSHPGAVPWFNPCFSVPQCVWHYGYPTLPNCSVMPTPPLPCYIPQTQPHPYPYSAFCHNHLPQYHYQQPVSYYGVPLPQIMWTYVSHMTKMLSHLSRKHKRARKSQNE